MSSAPIVLYGASGFTGRLIARELDRRDAQLVLAGRSRDKLEQLASTLRHRPEIRVANVSDAAALRVALAGARVVLSCAGPFTVLGPPVQDAALDAGTHFLDITGEQAYMRATFARDAQARERGVALVNAVGFDVMPTDLALHLATRALGAPVAKAELALSVASFGASRGTTRSAMLRVGDPGACYHGGAWREEPVGEHHRKVVFPSPVGARDVYSLPLADIATGPRTTGAREMRLYVRLPPTFARALPLVRLTRGLMQRLSAPRLLELWARRLPEGPSVEDRARSRFAIWARVESADGRSREVTATGQDPYGLTAATAAHAALELAADGPHPTGALSPTQALDPAALRGVLEGAGTTFQGA